MKIAFKFLAVSVIVLVVISILPSCGSTYLSRWIFWNFSDIEDYQKFPYRDVSNASPIFNFAPVSVPQVNTISYQYKGKNHQKTVVDFVNQTETTALIVIKNDSLLYEGYGSGYARSSINTSFSIAKSITSMLVGIAISEGKIKGTRGAITDYIPELLASDEQIKEVSISNLLMMQSGFYYRDHDLVWGDKPKNYYHPCLRQRALNVKLDEPPGERWQYMGYNPIICGMILERTTNQTVTKYFEDKLWTKIGAEFPASWSIDSEEGQMEKMESGVNGRAIDFAKLGRLMLLDGSWEGRQIISKEWVADCTSLDGSVEAWKGVHYKNFWWLYPSDDKHPQSYAATGHLGQFIFVSPEEKVVIVRFGKEMGKVDSWINIFREIATRVSE
ncbi:MAG: serine hydrolase [Cyclobacteriaceae bacterium]